MEVPHCQHPIDKIEKANSQEKTGRTAIIAYHGKSQNGKNEGQLMGSQIIGMYFLYAKSP
jgi:hypothetical protein